jgi:hypothetical protein
MHFFLEVSVGVGLDTWRKNKLPHMPKFREFGKKNCTPILEHKKVGGIENTYPVLLSRKKSETHHI